MEKPSNPIRSPWESLRRRMNIREDKISELEDRGITAHKQRYGVGELKHRKGMHRE